MTVVVDRLLPACPADPSRTNSSKCFYFQLSFFFFFFFFFVTLKPRGE
jgi:hypothetical protein